MTVLRMILGDQLNHSISSLDDCNKEKDIVLMCEVMEEVVYIKHHKKKIAFLFSAMRHFAISLKENGYTIYYTKLDDNKNTGSFFGEVRRYITKYNITRIIVTQPSEYRVLKNIHSWKKNFNIPIEIRADIHFFCEPEEFKSWAKAHNPIRMEHFYRYMRKKYSILMDGEKPEGGKWNYDSKNRKSPKEGLHIPSICIFKPDYITQDVLNLVHLLFEDHFGDLEPFNFAVNREEALTAFKQFIDQRLMHFGDFQDAMIEGEPFVFHSHISLYLNCGLLLPMECVKAVIEAYNYKKAPLNAVEGFIRQIIGWREYVRGVYWMKMPEYKNNNYFGAVKNLPDFYWTAKTKMNCLKQCVKETKENAYAHHIQRLMVLGNFALITGISPTQVNEWFLSVFVDAYEWVELPNVSGMTLFADGGFLASKPYAAGGNYINKMSNYCKNCIYKINLKNGLKACPFNYLFWDFLIRNRKMLNYNHRIRLLYKSYDRMSSDKKLAIELDSKQFLQSLT